jgi:HAE1 family hydrophobic/amphiphilic exporter-1
LAVYNNPLPCASIVGWNFYFNSSTNLITLFALVLAGVVVDDAIVVIEAVHAKMEEEHLSH